MQTPATSAQKVFASFHPGRATRKVTVAPLQLPGGTLDRVLTAVPPAYSSRQLARSRSSETNSAKVGQWLEQ